MRRSRESNEWAASVGWRKRTRLKNEITFEGEAQCRLFGTGRVIWTNGVQGPTAGVLDVVELMIYLYKPGPNTLPEPKPYDTECWMEGANRGVRGVTNPTPNPNPTHATRRRMATHAPTR
jgi:hypothetical protein